MTLFRSWLQMGSERRTVDVHASSAEEAKEKALKRNSGARWMHSAPVPENA